VGYTSFDSLRQGPLAGSATPREREIKKGRLGPSANNWKFRGHKADTQVEKRYLGHPAESFAPPARKRPACPV